MMAFDFDAVRRDFPLEETVSKVLPLRRSGSNKVAVCPFHPDKNPSLVLFKNQTYHCFGCSAHGDVIDFIAATQHLSIPDSIRYLTGGEAPRLDDADRERRHRETLERESQLKKQQENAVLEARARWARALPVNGVGNAYLTRKNVAPYGTRREGDNLLVPVYDEAGLILSVQSIPPEPGGRKLFHAGAPVNGGTFTLGDAAQGPVIIVEGFATGATVQAATGCLVIVGFSKGALRRTAEIAARRHPGREIIIGADANGTDKAHDAAEAVGGRVVVPDLQGADGTDFNDQAGHYGLEDVAALFRTDDDGALQQASETLGFKLSDWSTDRFFGEAPPIKWLCEGSIPLGVPALFAAMGGIGKSFMALDMALEIAAEIVGGGSSRRILGGPVVERGSVVVLSAEDGKDSVHRRMQRIDPNDRRERALNKLFVVPLPEVGGPMPLITGSGGEFRKTEKFEALMVMLAQISDLRLLVIDPLQAFITSDITKDPAAGQFMWTSFAQLCARTGATVIACHHMRKEGSSNITTADEAREAIRGSTALIDGARATYALWGATQDETRRVCVEANVSYAPKRVVHGAVVKANDEHDWEIHTYLRSDNGLLVDAHEAGKRAAQKTSAMTERQALHALQCIDARWRSGRPFSASANSQDRYIVPWMIREYGVSREVAKAQIEQWFHCEMLITDMADAKLKMTGLRVHNWPQ